MMHELVNLGRNLVAGLRLALFLPVSRLAFRIDVVQLLLLFVAVGGSSTSAPTGCATAPTRTSRGTAPATSSSPPAC